MAEFAGSMPAILSPSAPPISAMRCEGSIQGRLFKNLSKVSAMCFCITGTAAAAAEEQLLLMRRLLPSLYSDQMDSAKGASLVGVLVSPPSGSGDLSYAFPPVKHQFIFGITSE